MAGNRSTTANYCILTIPHDRIKFAELVQHCVQPVDFIVRAAHLDPSPVFSLAASLLAFLGNRPAPVLERSSLKHGAMKCGIHRAVLFLLVLAMSSSGAMAPVNLQGQWSTLPYVMPINPVHVALMYNGKVLVVSGSGNDASNTNLRAAVWELLKQPKRLVEMEHAARKLACPDAAARIAELLERLAKS